MTDLNTALPIKPVDPDLVCIPANYSRLIARELELHIKDLPSLLNNTGILVEEFLKDGFLLSSAQQIQVLKNALALANDETISLRFGRRLTPSAHGVMGFLANSSPNLLMALKAIQMFVPTRMHFARLEIASSRDWVECKVSFGLDVENDAMRSLSECFAMAFFEVAKFIVGQSLSDIQTNFVHDKPTYSHRYCEYLPGHYEFSKPELMVKIPMYVCQEPNLSANHENYSIALRQCKVMLKQLKPNEDTCKYQIQKMMLSHPPGVLNEEEAAAILFISKRTLARRLQQENTSFREIRDEILSQQATGYLRDSRMSVEAIAALLNYHDSANFRRAFKRWFQITPDQYRQRQSTE